MAAIPGYYPYSAIRFESTVAHNGAAPIDFCRLIDRERGSAANFIDASIVPVGADIGLHTHTLDNEEIYIILSGRGWMHLNGDEFEVHPGDVIVNPPGGTHSLKNIGQDELRLIVVEVPMSAGGTP